ncbi:MAG: hypothetical protein ACP5D0_01810 [Hydrogenovibrio sp.]
MTPFTGHDNDPITLRWVGQTEQVNGYYLIEWIAEPKEATEATGKINALNSVRYPINLSIVETNEKDAVLRAFLFKQQENRLFFLSPRPFQADNTQLDTHPTTRQAWVFLDNLRDGLLRDKPLLITASQRALATAFWLAANLKVDFELRLILAAETGFPFTVKPARFLFPGFPSEAIGAAPLLEDWGLPNRLCHRQGLPGCYEGDLSTLWQDWQPPEDWQHLDVDNLN